MAFTFRPDEEEKASFVGAIIEKFLLGERISETSDF